MKYISFLIIPLIVSGVIAFLKQPKKAEKGKVFLPKFFIILGVILSTIFLIPTVITAYFDEPIWVSLIFFSLSLISAFFIIAFINCRIHYDKNGFTVKNILGIKKSYTYDKVTAIKEDINGSYIYLGKRRISIDGFSVGGFEFILFVKKEYKRLNKCPLPQVYKTRFDIFNGNIFDAAGFLFVYIFIGLFIIAFSILIIFQIFSPQSAENTVIQNTVFDSFVVSDDDVILKSTKDERYEIRFIDENFDTETLEHLCDKSIPVTTYSKEYARDGENLYVIYAIYQGDNCVLSFDETNHLHKNGMMFMIIFPIIMAIFWGVFVTGSIIVGRNPQKYSRKVIKIFFQEGYVRY